MRKKTTGFELPELGIKKEKNLNRLKTDANLQTMRRIIEANFEIETKVQKIQSLLDECYD